MSGIHFLVLLYSGSDVCIKPSVAPLVSEGEVTTWDTRQCEPGTREFPTVPGSVSLRQAGQRVSIRGNNVMSRDRGSHHVMIGASPGPGHWHHLLLAESALL